MKAVIPKIEAGEDGKFHCPEPNCKKPVWKREWGFKVHWARVHGPNAGKKEDKREQQKRKARERYQAKKRDGAPEPELDYSCPVCGTPQGPIIKGIKEAISQRISCRNELTR